MTFVLAILSEDDFHFEGGITPLIIIGAIILGFVMHKFAQAQEQEYRRTHCSHGRTTGHRHVSGESAKWCEGPRP